MGINKLLPQLYGGRMEDQLTGFAGLEDLKNKKNGASIDTGTLIFVCALVHKSSCLAGDYRPAVAEFQRRITILICIYKWDANFVFDGVPPEAKRYEHERRQDDKDRVPITSTYILMCVKVCQQMFLKYVVAPEEADMQAGREGNSRPVCRDSDLAAYNNKIIYIIDSYFTETYRKIDLTVPDTPELRENYPLHGYYIDYGRVVIHWWAAVLGCDISKSRGGISGLGDKAFLDALGTFSQRSADLNSSTFSEALLKCAKQAVSWEAKEIEAELDRVTKWFLNGGSFYDKEGNLLSNKGDIIRKADDNPLQLRHMRGDVDPRSMAELTVEQTETMSRLEPHNLLHNSKESVEQIKGISLPAGRNSLDECRNPELKAMIVARGGNVTGDDGKALNGSQMRQLLRAYMSREELCPLTSVHFKRDR
ncbi:hypothetical protein THAOC_11399, partial [Thalassiosira oceanica]